MKIDAELCTAFPGSHKIYRCGSLYPDVRVPMRDIHLCNQQKLTVYDTNGTKLSDSVIPAKQESIFTRTFRWVQQWIPAFAGMTYRLS